MTIDGSIETGPEISRGEFLDRINSLLPAIGARSAETERSGRIGDETISELEHAGVLGGLQPRRWGGLELDPATFFEGIVAIGSACASTGWVTSVLGMHPWEIGCMAPQAQADVWSKDPTSRVCSSYAPTGSARPHKDGFWLSGWWGFSSGIDHCKWALLGAIVDGQEHLGPRVFLIPTRELVVDHASWDVTGLAGTGSKDLTVNATFVPYYRTHTMAEFNDPQHDRPGWEFNTGPLYRFGFTDLFSWGIGAPALGAATGFAQNWVNQTRKRVAGFGGKPVAAQSEVQANLAEGVHRVNVLHRSMVSAWNEVYDVVSNGDPLDPLAQRQLHYQGARTISASLEAALAMFATSGGGVMHTKNPLQRFLRDLLAMRNHPVASLGRFAKDQAQTEFVDTIC